MLRIAQKTNYTYNKLLFTSIRSLSVWLPVDAREHFSPSEIERRPRRSRVSIFREKVFNLIA